MLETKAELADELRAHGFQSLEPGRPEIFIHQAAYELQLEHLWEWRLRTFEGASGDAIPDLGAIEQVWAAAGQPLAPSTAADMRDLYGSALGESGVAQSYYRDGKSVLVHPSEDVSIRYYSTFPWIDENDERIAISTEPTDRLLCPVEYTDVVMLGATKRAWRDNNEADLAQQVSDEWAIRVEQMKNDDGIEQVDEPRKVLLVDEYGV